MIKISRTITNSFNHKPKHQHNTKSVQTPNTNNLIPKLMKRTYNYHRLGLALAAGGLGDDPLAVR